MSREPNDPLADALNAMHDNDDENQLRRPAEGDEQIDRPADAEDELNLGTFADDIDGSTQDLTELAGPAIAASGGGGPTTMSDAAADIPAIGGPRPRPTPRTRVRRPTKLHHTGVKACLIIGMLLLIPALWAVAVLVGLSVPMSNRPSATSMAIFMLICWPVAIALIGGAIYFAKHYAKLDAMFDAQERKA